MQDLCRRNVELPVFVSSFIPHISYTPIAFNLFVLLTVTKLLKALRCNRYLIQIFLPSLAIAHPLIHSCPCSF